MIRLASLFALLLLAACAVTQAPFGREMVTPMLGEDSFRTHDGLALPVSRWDAEDPEHPRAVIVALHGMSDYANAFDLPATAWAKAGITTLAYDQRGFGRGPNPGLWPGAAALRQDLRDCVDAAHARYPGIPVYALGESMGGAVLLTALADAPETLHIAGAILVAPAVWSRHDMPLSYRVALFLAAHVTPGLNVSGSGLKIVPSDNVPMLRALSRDPYFQKKTRADAVYGLVNLMDEARAAPLKLGQSPPLLLLYGSNDQIIPREPTEGVIAALDGRAAVRNYPNGYHMLLRDLDRSDVERDVLSWIETHYGRKTRPGNE